MSSILQHAEKSTIHHLLQTRKVQNSYYRCYVSIPYNDCIYFLFFFLLMVYLYLWFIFLFRVELCGEFVPLPPGTRITRPERVARNGPTVATGDSSENAVTLVSPPVIVGTPFEPSTVLHMLRDMNYGDSFRIEGRQEDAEEFLGCLLNGLNDEMLEVRSRVSWFFLIFFFFNFIVLLTAY